MTLARFGSILDDAAGSSVTMFDADLLQPVRDLDAVLECGVIAEDLHRAVVDVVELKTWVCIRSRIVRCE